MSQQRRVFSTDEERKEGRHESKRKWDSRRISLGTAFEDWEAHRATCGFTNVDFAKHLLALHASRCSNFTGVVMGHARSTESRRLV